MLDILPTLDTLECKARGEGQDPETRECAGEAAITAQNLVERQVDGHDKQVEWDRV